MTWSFACCGDPVMDLSTAAAHPRYARLDHPRIHRCRSARVRSTSAGEVDGNAEYLPGKSTAIPEATLPSMASLLPIHAGVLLRYVRWTASRMTGHPCLARRLDMAKWCLRTTGSFLYTHFEDLCDSHEDLLRELLARRWPAARLRLLTRTTRRIV